MNPKAIVFVALTTAIGEYWQHSWLGGLIVGLSVVLLASLAAAE